MQYDADPMETILLCRVPKGAIEDHLPGRQPEMFTTGESSAIGALDGTGMFRVHRNCSPMDYVRIARRWGFHADTRDP